MVMAQGFHPRRLFPLSMPWRPVYARKLFDISWEAIWHAIGASTRQASWHREQAAIREVEQLWAPSQTLVALCVRSALDLFLQTCDFPAGSEVIMSAITVPDMVRIVQAHGLVPVPLDLQADASVSAVDVKGLITPKTKVILVAQLFGARHALHDVAELARKNGIVLVEDCAQAFRGRGFTGTPGAAVSLFSFGPIKTCTAFGGALVTVRDLQLLDKMRMAQSRYPQQSNRTFLKRVVKYASFKFLTDNPYFYGLFIAGLRMLGRDHDRVITHLSHSLAADAALIPQLRIRPSTALTETLGYRISHFNPAVILQRERRIQSLATECPAVLQPVGFKQDDIEANHHYWIYPVRVENPREVLKSLLAAGFDAASGDASLALVNHGGLSSREDNTQRDETVPTAAALLKQVVYLPVDNHFSVQCQAKLVGVLYQTLHNPAAASF
jgi:perosamine synthetase